MRAVWCVGGSVVIHGLLLTAPAWRPASPVEPHVQRLAVRLLAAGSPAPPVLRTRVASERLPKVRTAALPPHRQARAAIQAKQRVGLVAPDPQRVDRAPLQPVEPAPPELASVPIDSRVFGLPHIGFGAVAQAADRAASPGTNRPPVPRLDLAQIRHAEAIEGARRQILWAIQSQLEEAPGGIANGTCFLDVGREESIACDSEVVLRIVSAKTAALFGLLGAYRSLDPRIVSLEIAYTQGRPQVRLNGENVWTNTEAS